MVCSAKMNTKGHVKCLNIHWALSLYSVYCQTVCTFQYIFNVNRGEGKFGLVIR